MAVLERLIYVSRATRSQDSLLALAEILAVSRRNNARDGLTGGLAAHDGRYVQVVEGARAPLDGLMARLAADLRHEGLTILDRRIVEGRAFGQWSMASARITPDLADALDALMADDGLHSPERTVGLMKWAASHPVEGA